MPLPYEIDDVSEAPEAARSFYTEKNGKYVLDVDGVKPLAEFNTVYKSLGEERGAHKKTKEILGRFGDTKPEDLAVMNDRIAELSASAGTVDEAAIEKIVAARTSPLVRERDKHATEAAEKQTRIAELEAKIVTGERKQLVSGLASDKIKPEFLRDAQLRAQVELKYDPDQERFVDQFGATPEEWFNRQMEETPSWVVESTSAGAKGGKGGESNENVFDRTSSAFNMTAQMDMVKSDPKRAKALAARVGFPLNI